MTPRIACCSRFAILVPLLALVACGDSSTSPAPEPQPGHVTLESANATSGKIGPAGGSLHTTASDGTVYTLTIPADALPAGKTITMTPVTKIEGYPLAGGVVAGVELRPSGTVFTVPVTLQIATGKTPAGGTTPVAILYSGDAASFEPSFAGSGAGTFTVPMTHFSGGTVGFATAQELEALASSGSATCLQPAVQLADSGDVSGVFSLYHVCFASDVLPALENASNDVQLATAIGQFAMWKSDSRLTLGVSFAAFDDAAETSQFFAALVGKLQAAIDRNNQNCEQNESLASLANVLFWQKQAARFGLDTPANLLDRNAVLLGLCAHAVVDNLVIPADIQVGFPHSIDIQFGLLFDGHQDSQGVPFGVTLTGDGVDIQHPTGFTDNQGKYTTVITATREGEILITARACLIYPGTQTASDVCIEATGSTNAINLNGQWSGTTTLGSAFPVCVVLSQNQNAITGTIQQFGGTAAFTATLSGHQLLNVTVDGFFGEANCVATGTGTADGTTITLDVVAQPPCNSVQVTYTFTRGTCP